MITSKNYSELEEDSCIAFIAYLYSSKLNYLSNRIFSQVVSTKEAVQEAVDRYIARRAVCYNSNRYIAFILSLMTN